MTSVPETVRATIRHHDLVLPGEPLVLLVSGGGDSTALLMLAAEGVLGDVTPHVLHVNHLLRGDESDADERFVSALCERLGIEHTVVRTDVAAYAAAERLNLEDAGRRVRHRLAEELADDLSARAGLPAGSGAIATGHTLDDRVETLLMRLVAGAGAGGLAAIRHRRGRVVRPMLDVTRAEVRAWLESRGETWREDASNADTERSRAWVRHELLPLLERRNPSVRETLARTAAVLADEDALLGEMAEAFAAQFATAEPGRSVVFDRTAMATLSRAMARRTVRTALLNAFPEASRLEAAHVEALLDGLDTPGFARDLPFGLRAESEYTGIRVFSAKLTDPAVAPSLLRIPGRVSLGRVGEIIAEEAEPDGALGGGRSVVIDATGIEHLTVDGVRPGDRMQPLGMTGTRKLSDLLIDAKIPRRARAGVPVVRDGERIVWLAGVRISESARVTEATERAVRLTWTDAETGEDPAAGEEHTEKW